MSMKVERWAGEGRPDALALRGQMESEGYSVFQWTDAPGRAYSEHTHPEDQSHWILSGAITIVVGRDEYTLRAGDRDFLKAGVLHSARVEGREPCVYLVGAKEEQAQRASTK